MGTAPFFQVQPTVFLVESPSADDLYEDRTEARALSSALKLAGIENVLHTALDLESFKRALSDAAVYISNSLRHIRPHLIPILHVSAHGNADGLALSRGEFLSWDDLRSLLLGFLGHAKSVVDREDDLSLTSLCLSTCKGAHARRMFDAGAPYPCLGLVGSEDDVEWPDALTAFITFYHQLFYKDVLVPEAVASMNQAAGVGSFHVYFPDDIGEYFRQYGLFASEELESRIRGNG